MQRRKVVNILVLASLLLMLVAPVASAQFTPAIFAVSQEVVDGIVNVTRVVSDGPGWVVIHADDGGQPGAVLGQSAIPSGIGANIKVTIDTAAATPVLHAMLHTDAGVEGVFELPGDDAAVEVNGKPVAVTFDVTAYTVAEVEEVAAEEVAAAEVPAEPAGPADIVDTLSAAGNFRTLSSAIKERGLDDALRGEGPYTLFAPSDAAFSALPLTDRIRLYRDPGTLEAVLLNHVVEGIYLAADLVDGAELTAVGGGTLAVAVDENGTTVNGVKIEQADVAATNGVIQVLAGVILPSAEEVAAAAEAAATESTEAASTESTEAAATESTEAASTESTEAAATESTEAAATESTEAAATESTEAAATESTEAAATESTEAAATESTEAAATESTEAPAAGEAAAPTTVPATGASAQNNALVTLLVSVLMVVMVGAFALVGRRTTR